MRFSTTTTDPEALTPLGLDRESFAYLIANQTLCDPGQIRAAVARADYDDAAIRALAAAKLGRELPSDLVANVLVGVERIEVFLPLARQTTAERLLDLLGRGRFADEPNGIAQTSYAVFALWQLQSPDVVRRSLLPRLRRLARCPDLPALAGGMVAWLVTELDDPQLRSIYETRQGAIADQQVGAPPALGILVARGALATNSLFEGDLLLDWIEEARDDLELPPGYPAQRVFDAQARLDDVTNRLKAMEQQSAERELELERDLRDACRVAPARNPGADRNCPARASRATAEGR